MTVYLIVAHDENNAIGLENKLLWSIPEDMKFFRETTTGNCVLMGRKTFESIGRLLPNRCNFIMSRNRITFAHTVKSKEDGYWISDFDMEKIKIIEQCRGDVYIIGGAEIYKQALDSGIVDYIYATEVKGKFEADSFLPFYKDSYKLKEVIRPLQESKSGNMFEINLYEKKV